MHDLSFVRENFDLVSARLRDRDTAIDLGPFMRLDERRRALLRDVEGLKQRRNQANEEITRLRKTGRDASGLIAEMRDLAVRIEAFDAPLKQVQAEMEEILIRLPNLPHETVPVGRVPHSVVVVE